MHPKSVHLSIISCAAGLVFSIGLSSGADPSTLSTLDSAQQVQRNRPRWMIRCQIDGVSECALARGLDGSLSFQLDCTCFRDGERLDVRTTRADNGKPLRAWRSIVNGWYLSYEAPPKGGTALSGLYAADGASFAGAAMPSGWGVFDEYFVGDYVRFSNLLRTASKVETAQEDVNGCRCLALKADVPDYGHYEVWLDPAINYLPRKVLVEKNGPNYWGGTRIAQWTKLAPRGSRGTVRLQSVTYTMDDATFDRVGGRPFPLGCRVARVQKYEDGNIESTVMTCRRTALDLAPDFAGAKAFVPELREGARLANQIDPYLAYQWVNSKPVPLVDPGLVDQMNHTARTLKQELDRRERLQTR